MEILRLLDRSNCGRCHEPTCLAFAVKVFNGERMLDECPKRETGSPGEVSGHIHPSPPVENNLEKQVEVLKHGIAHLDFSSLAQKVGGKATGNRLTIKIFGKDFTVDTEGRLYSDIHGHPWATMPILSYLMDATGTSPSGTWVPFRALKNGKTWHGLFKQRCEQPLKRVADQYTSLFEEMIHIFNGRQVTPHYASDISVVLYPLPKLPLLICYWYPEDDLDSDLTLFFDSTAEEQLNIEAIFAMGTGLVRMFEKIAWRHGFKE